MFKHLSPRRTIKLGPLPPVPPIAAEYLITLVDDIGTEYWEGGPTSYMGFYDSTGDLYYIWFNYDGVLSDDTGLTGTAIEVTIGAGLGITTPAQIATQIISGLDLVTIPFTYANNGDGTITIVADVTGATTSPISFFDVTGTPPTIVTSVEGT